MTLTTFSKKIKKDTSKSHSMAENTGFVTNFLAGVVSKESYKQLIADFYFIYTALEEQVEKFKDDPFIAPIAFDELKRVPALEKDCEFYWGKGWKSIITPTDACKNYVRRVKKINAKFLVGHHYTRYLGDLSGGQILKNIANKSMNLNGEGLAFYEFEGISNPGNFKNRYRTALDNLPITWSDGELIINEANYAFKLNMDVFDEIGSSRPFPLLSTIKGLFQFAWGSINSKK
jgi:heme oxygenase